MELSKIKNVSLESLMKDNFKGEVAVYIDEFDSVLDLAIKYNYIFNYLGTNKNLKIYDIAPVKKYE